MLASATRIGRVRLRSNLPDRALASMRLGRALAAADFHPASLPSPAILCLRRLGDPKPGRLRLDGRALRPPADWEDSARDAVARAAATAARPAHGPVPADTEAVLFADRAELLACLARDWCDGLFHVCWWWRVLLGSREAAETVLHAFRETPAAVPAALDGLARAGRLEPFLRRLPSPVARVIAADVGRAFGLDDLGAAIVLHGRAWQDGSDTTEVTRVDTTRGSAIAEDLHVDPRVASIAPDAARIQLDGAARALAVIALVLHRTPVLAASVLRPATVPGRSPRLPWRLPARSNEATNRSWGRFRRWGQDVTELPPPAAPVVAAPSQEFDQPRVDPVEANSPQQMTQDASTAAERPPDGWPVAPAPEALEAVDTAFGGAFYFINVATALGLYADFTAPRRRNLPLPIWDFIAIVADRLGGPGFGDDPLSALLASLARRGPDQPMDPRHASVRRVRRLVPPLRRRIASALGVHPNVAGPLLVVSPARVLVAPATIEVRFTLAALPIEVRLAGLDRDPGFVPAAARTVVFRYA